VLPGSRRSGRPRSLFPTPNIRNRDGVKRIFWWADGRTYEMSIGRLSDHDAETCRLEILLALRGEEWPAWARQRPAVQAYLRSHARRDAAPEAELLAPSGLADYEKHLRASVGDNWAGTSLAMLRELAAFAGRPLEQVDPATAEAFLDHIVQTPGPRQGEGVVRSAATRNRARAACGRLYRWAMRTRGLAVNPFAETAKLPEEKAGQIVHLSRAERNTVLKAAAGLPSELAVWLALYAGLRRGEIIRCEWGDLNLRRRKLTVPKSKTRRPRVIDLAKPIVERLRSTRGRPGRVVPWPEGQQAAFHEANLLVQTLRTRAPKVPRERIGWTPFRHTFASLLVQAGVSIFKVASWMGNSVEVCRRHYAAMRPDHDPDIERLG